MRFTVLVTLVAMLVACDAKDATDSPSVRPQATNADTSAAPSDTGSSVAVQSDGAKGTNPAPGDVLASDDPSGASVVTLDGLTITLAQGWVTRTPSSSMRAAEVALPSVEGEDEASLVVFHFGPNGAGTAEANLARWRSQFSMPDGSDPSEHAVIESIDVGGRAVAVMRLEGTYVAETTPGSGERVNKENWSLVGAVVETSAGPYYLKVVGPASAIGRERASIDAMLAGITAR